MQYAYRDLAMCGRHAEVGHKPWFMLIHKMQSHYESMKET